MLETAILVRMSAASAEVGAGAAAITTEEEEAATHWVLIGSWRGTVACVVVVFVVSCPAGTTTAAEAEKMQPLVQ